MVDSLDRLTKVFIKHYSQNIFKSKTKQVDKWLAHKVRHSYWVLFAMQRIISIDPNLKDVDADTKKNLEIAALLHDISRMYQHDWEKLISNDVFEHGDASYNILKDEGIDNIYVLLAVKYHNKYNISWLYKDKEFIVLSDEDKNKTLLFVKAIRDADKLQNIEEMIFTDWKWLEKINRELYWITDESYISEHIIDDLLSWKLVSYNNAHTQSDMYIVFASWLSEIYFTWTKSILKLIWISCFISNKLEKFSINLDDIKKVINFVNDKLNIIEN